jgi:hypothetical protein
MFFRKTFKNSARIRQESLKNPRIYHKSRRYSTVTQIEKKSVRQATGQTTVGQCTSGWAICWAPGGQRVATELRQLGNSLGNDWAMTGQLNCDSWAIELRQSCDRVATIHENAIRYIYNIIYSLNFIYSLSDPYASAASSPFLQNPVLNIIQFLNCTNRSCDLVIRYWRRFKYLSDSFILAGQATLLDRG